ncbi:hypothetical protein [Paracoccus simplex]|uniref:DNA-binding protein n=1 Tax=Paracoccus simplex TaxID=2086346 RepID=A0ABV7S4Z6_9RHOB
MAERSADIPAETRPVWACEASFLAEEWGVTIRRVRQMAEEGRLRRCGRGLFDWTHGELVKFGASFLGQDRARGIDGDTLAAVGWLGHFWGRKPAPVTAEELAVWCGLCARWGLSEHDASALIARAAAMRGEHCPPFATSAH